MIRWQSVFAVVVLVAGASAVSAQQAAQNPVEEVALTEYCGNIGTVKSINNNQIVLEGMNWDFDSEAETIEETYEVGDLSKIDIDGYGQLMDIKPGDFISIGCQKKDGKNIVVSIQSEEAVNRSFQDTADVYEEYGKKADPAPVTVEVQPMPSHSEQPASASADVTQASTPAVSESTTPPAPVDGQSPAPTASQPASDAKEVPAVQ